MTKSEILSKLSIISKHGGLQELPYSAAVFALGTFDGVHIAHKALINKAQQLKKALKADAVAVFSFSESPASVMGRTEREVLTGRDEKIKLLLDCGADIVVMADFNDFCGMSAEDFVHDVLCSALLCRGTVCGFNHRFGRGGMGNFKLLESVFDKGSAISVPKIMLGGETVSSSTIRSLISSGELEDANRMLGRPLCITAEIKDGKKLGRKLGFPTANQTFPNGFVKLRHGVYATRCHVGGKEYFGVSNVGIRPSISDCDDHVLNCETYLIDFSGNLYGQLMKVEFFKHMRDEVRFPSLEALVSAIESDKAKVIEYFKNTSH